MPTTEQRCNQLLDRLNQGREPKSKTDLLSWCWIPGELPHRAVDHKPNFNDLEDVLNHLMVNHPERAEELRALPFSEGGGK